MRNSILIVVILLTGMNLRAQNGGVEVKIVDVVAEWGGTVNIGVFEKNGFPKIGESFINVNVPVRDIEATHRFENIPPGTYAIAVFQDINGDDELNRDIYRRPTEPYAFSNNVFGRFGPPEFALASFNVEVGIDSKLEIRLKD